MESIEWIKTATIEYLDQLANQDISDIIIPNLIKNAI
jgi:hypothetical protein